VVWETVSVPVPGPEPVQAAGQVVWEAVSLAAVVAREVERQGA
jgi:hypothetical protein